MAAALKGRSWRSFAPDLTSERLVDAPNPRGRTRPRQNLSARLWLAQKAEASQGVRTFGARRWQADGPALMADNAGASQARRSDPAPFGS